MLKKFIYILTSVVACLSLAAAPLSAKAATPEEAAALARSMGLPESLIQAGWNKYYENPELYPPELIDSYMATLRGMNQDMINQLLTDNGYAPSAPAAPAPVSADGTQVKAPMPGSVIKKGARVEYAIVGENCVIGEGAHIGDRPERIEDKSQWGVAVIGHKVNVSANAVAAPKAMISKDI